MSIPSAEEMILSDIISIKPAENGLRLTNLFGEEEIIEASIEEVDLLNHKIKLTPR